MNSLYDPGTEIRLSCRFEREGSLKDPTSVTCKVRAPDGQTTTYTYPNDIVRDDVGRYHLDLTPTYAGIWTVKWIAIGEVTATTEHTFRTRKQVIP